MIPQHAEAALKQIYSFIENNEPIVAYQKALALGKMHHSNPYILKELGVVYKTLGNWAKVYEVLLSVLSLGLTGNELNLKLAEAEINTNRLVAAKERLTRILEDEPWHEGAILLLAKALWKIEGAEAFFDFLASKENLLITSHKIWFALGEAHGKRGDFSRAASCFSTAISLG